MFKCIEDTLSLETQASKAMLVKMLGRAEKANPPISTIRKLRTQTFDEWGTIAKLETLCNTYFGEIDTTKKDAVAQLSFQNEHLRSLNHIPFILLALSLFKIYAVPLMAIFMPVLAFVLPYVILRFVYQIPMTFSRYTDLLKGMWFGSKDTSYVQIFFFIFSLLQGIIQPIQNAMHYNTTDSVICETGKAILEVRAYCIRLREYYHVTRILDEFPVDDPRRCFFLVFENPGILTSVFENLGELEVLWKVAQNTGFREVTFIEPGQAPYLEIQGLQDLSIPLEKRVLSDIKLDKTSHHCLVTGPNGGGKSSAMRAILQSVVLAQTFGVACVTSMTLRPFKWISSGLSLHDTPGVKSMFQTEVQFAAKLLRKRMGKGPGLILYDELFHSTNPPDCVRTANIFMRRLWKRKDIASFLSTHVFELVDEAPVEIQRLCVGATYENKKLRFLYKLSKGICKVSSVYSILKREGLLASEEVR
jgi:hypothetical protein